MLLHCELLALLLTDFPPTAIDLVRNQTNLQPYASLLSQVLQPISNVLKCGTSGNVEDYEGTISLTIVTKWARRYFIVMAR